MSKPFDAASLLKAVDGLPTVDASGPKCQGRLYRGRVNYYMAKDGNLRDDRRLNLLKRKSCKGCEECYWIEEALKEHIDSVGLDLTFVEDFGTYELVAQPGEKYWTDCGWEYDGPEFDFEHLKEYQK